MISYVYVVHSKVDEENIYNEFETLAEAVEYAKEYIDKQTYVEQVEVEINDFGEVVDSGEPQLAWSYEGDEAADHEADEDITAEEEAELDADYQAMAEAEHPIDEAVSTKKDYHARLDELEAKLEAMDEDVCKDYKVITHSEDEVKDLKESLLHEGVSAEAVAVVSELLEDEWEAISGYEDAAAKLAELDVADKEKVLHVLDHISEEESIHVGQLEQIVKLLNPEHIAKQDEGHEEGAEELAGKAPHEEASIEEEPEEEPVEESLTEDVDEDYKAALKKALPLLKKDGVFGVVLGYDQGKGYIYLDKPLVKKSAKELAEYQKSFSTGKQAVKATIRTVYPNQITEIEELLGIEPMSEAVATDEYDIRNIRGHFEIYKGTEFVGTADTEAEAEKELEKLVNMNEDLIASTDNELKDLLAILSNKQLVDFNNKHWAETTTYENGKFNLYDHNANKPYNTMSRDEFENLIIKTMDEDEVKDLKNLVASLHINEEIDYNKLREELEENEDEVECQVCFDIVPKEEAIKTDSGYYICKHCADLEEAVDTQEPKVGMAIKIIAMPGDPIEKEYIGRTGKITYIDDAKQLHGTWGGLALLPGIDKYEIISEAKLKESLSVLDFFKKVVNKNARRGDFLKRAAADINYVDEVAPGLHSITELSKAELKELSEFVKAKIK